MCKPRVCYRIDCFAFRYRLVAGTPTRSVEQLHIHGHTACTHDLLLRTSRLSGPNSRGPATRVLKSSIHTESESRCTQPRICLLTRRDTCGEIFNSPVTALAGIDLTHDSIDRLCETPPMRRRSDTQSQRLWMRMSATGAIPSASASPLHGV